MALKLNVENVNIPLLLKGILALEGVSEVYMRIDRFSGEGNICRFVLGYFNVSIESVQQFDELAQEVKTIENIVFSRLNFPEKPYEFIMIEDGTSGDFNVRKQGYEYLKTLPEFSGCEDC